MAVRGEGIPAKDVLPSCSTWLVLPCIRLCARTTLPPKAAPMAWWPRHTPKERHLAREMADHVDADAGFLRRAGAGRDHDTVGCSASIFVDRDLVVAAHVDLCAQFAHVLDQVVGERVVVIENENHAATGFLHLSYRVLYEALPPASRRLFDCHDERSEASALGGSGTDV